MNNGTGLKSILLFAASPKATKNLRLQEEEREIKERLRIAGYGKIPINSAGATRSRDIQQAMLDFKPQIVHFSDHGAGRDGLVFEDATGQGKLVSSEALAGLFKLFSESVKCVVLNACYSQFQAEVIAQHIDYVVGMSEAIGDHAAIEFAVGFYTALGAGKSIEFAYRLGCNAIQLEGIPEHLTPVLFQAKMSVTGHINSDAVSSLSKDEKMLARWLPRLNDRSRTVREEAAEKLSSRAMQDPSQQAYLIPLLLKHICTEESWTVICNCILCPLSDLPKQDPQWINLFLNTYIFLGRKGEYVIGENAYRYIWKLIEEQVIDQKHPKFREILELAEQGEKSSDDDIRLNSLLILDWYEDL